MNPRHGFTLIELLLAVAITAMLGLAVAAALRASLMAYGTTARAADASTSARMVMQQTMAMIRTASLHDAHDPNNPGLSLLPPAHPDHPRLSPGLRVVLADGRDVRIWWAPNTAYADADLGDLWISQVGQTAQPLARRALCQRTDNGDPYVFTLASRDSDDGLLLARATLQLIVLPEPDSGAAIEQAAARVGAVQLVGSTMPRRNLD